MRGWGVTVAGVTALLVERHREQSPTKESTVEEGPPIHEVFIKNLKNRVNETDSDAQDTASSLCRKWMRITPWSVAVRLERGEGT